MLQGSEKLQLQFGLLTPFEPRLIKKLQPPITDLISTTPAISLLYECVHTCIIGGMLTGPSGYSLAKTCVTKLANFLSDSDQNCEMKASSDLVRRSNARIQVKYIALLALTKIVPTHPHLVAEYESQILESINDPDLSIRMRALDLLSAMASQDSHNAAFAVTDTFHRLTSITCNPLCSSSCPCSHSQVHLRHP